MKLFLVVAAIAIIPLSSDTCKHKTANSTAGVYKAKLETKALCMNYTLRVISGDIDTSLVNTSWTDENTGKTYKQAFGLANPCDFPTSIQQGDEFYFRIDTVRAEKCAVCMAYYPTPSKKLIIKVVTSE